MMEKTRIIQLVSHLDLGGAEQGAINSGLNEERLRMKLGDYANVSLYDKIYGLSAYLNSFDYLFMPSNHEGLALMPIEASLAHTPPIINRCPGLEETLPVDWPLAVDNNSVEGFIGIFKNVLENIDYDTLNTIIAGHPTKSIRETGVWKL